MYIHTYTYKAYAVSVTLTAVPAEFQIVDPDNTSYRHNDDNDDNEYYY